MIIQAQVKSLFENPNAIGAYPKIQVFSASTGWFEVFKGCHRFHNLKLTGEAAAAYLVAAEIFPVLLKVKVESHGYLL
jgi:hypothetical protein